MVTASFWASALPLAGAAGALVSGSLWAVRRPGLSLIFLSFTLVLGQVVRFPLPGQGGGLLVSDIAVLLVIAAAMWQRPNHAPGSDSAAPAALGFTKRSRRLPAGRQAHWGTPSASPVAQGQWKLILLLFPFIIWSLASLMISPLSLGGAELVVAAAYWVRLCAHLLLIPALILICRTTQRQAFLARLIVMSAVALALLGLGQLIAVPQLRVLGGRWDPHSYRLVATWLDPNLIGGFFAVLLPWLAARATQWHRYRWGAGLLIGLVGTALLLTQSRSSLLALGGGLILTSPLYVYSYAKGQLTKAIRLGAVVVGLVVVAALGIWLLGERVWGLFTFDPTVQLRLDSLSSAWSLALDHGVVGVGYNAYQFAAGQAGLINDFTIHSRAGADNSWLTLWVTTGIIGVVLFVLPWLWIASAQLRQVVLYRRPQALACLTGLVVWFVHSQLVNSLLYAHLLIAVAMMIAATWPHQAHD